MDHKKTVETIVKIEAGFDVNSITYKEIMVWPIIRHSIVCCLLNPSIKHVVAPVKEKRTGLIDSYKKKKELKRAKEENREQLQKLASLGQRDILFFTRDVEHEKNSEGRYYNRFIDPMAELVKDTYSYMKFELSSPAGRDKSPRSTETELVKQDYYLLKKRLDEAQSGVNGAKIEGFEALKNFVRDLTGTVELDEPYLTAMLETTLAYRDFFSEILSVSRPKALFLVCYYYHIAMGLISACKELGITSIDVQHGKQGKYCGFNTHWTKIPDEGYAFIPDFFWVWGKESQDNINSEQGAGYTHHRAIVGGNRWFAKWANGEGFSPADNEKEFYDSLKRYNKVVLFTLQPLEEPVPQFTLEAMREAPKDWIWLLRLHPVRIDQKEEIEKMLRENGIDNFDVANATSSSLFSLMEHVDHHLTAWSTVCYEALPFNVPTTIVHKTGFDLYSDYIKRGIFTYAVDSKTLIKAIEKEYKPEELLEPAPYIETDINTANEALDSIFNTTRVGAIN